MDPVTKRTKARTARRSESSSVEEAAGAGLGRGSLAVLGIPWDEKSSFLRGPSAAPPCIRQAFHSSSTNTATESGIELSREPRLRFLGDLDLDIGNAAFETIERSVSQILAQGSLALCLGGDHSVSLPIVRAYGRHFPGLELVHIDAHPDLYDELDGDRLSHACPFSRIMEEGLVSRLVQLGIRTINPHQRAQANRFGVEIVEMRDWRVEEGLPQDLAGPIYLSVDLDALDPAFAPGVSHPEPGGLSTRELIGLIQGLPLPLVGADIVELNPVRDPQGLTARVAAKLLKEIAARMLADETT
jgi:arginase